MRIKPPEETEVLGIRLMLARAYIALWEKAYEALLYFGVNTRELPEYQDHTLLDEANTLVIQDGRNKVLLWIERVTSGIDAAVRRKQFKLLNGKGPSGANKQGGPDGSP